MNTGIVSMRYAKSLFAYATEQGAEDAIYANMLQLMHTLQQVRELTAVLAGPSLTNDERVALLCSAVDSSPVYEDFIRLVVEKEREPLLIFIAHCYISLYRKAKKILAVTLTTAVPIDDGLRAKVSAAVARGDKVVELTEKVNPDIIGGFVCETDSHRFDASIKRQIRDVEKELIKQNRKLV